jgi:phospholipid transport system substrate-binding protein
MNVLALRRTLAAAVLAGICLVGPMQVFADEAPAAFVARVGAKALTLAPTDHGAQQERSGLRHLIADSFDLALIGRFVLGTNRDLASTAQLAEYEHLFAEYLIAVNTRRLSHYAGGRLTVTGEQLIEGGVLVATEIAAKGAVPVIVHWRLRAAQDGHKVVDLIVLGASLLVTQRDEFAAIVRRLGVEGLIDTLRRRTALAETNTRTKTSG